MKIIRNIMDQILKAVMMLLSVSIVLSVLLQVFYRYFFDGYLGWTEEYARYALAWTVFIGMAYGFGQGEHLVVDIFTYKLTGKKAERLIVAGELVSLLFCVVMFFVSLKGYRTVATTRWTTVHTLSYGIVYLSLPTGLVLSAFYLICNLLDRLIAHFGKGVQT